jgi:hypothetical protein
MWEGTGAVHLVDDAADLVARAVEVAGSARGDARGVAV